MTHFRSLLFALIWLGAFQYSRAQVPGLGQIAVVAGSGSSAYSGVPGPALSASFSVSDMISDGQGNLYIADAADNRILKYDAVSNTVNLAAGRGVNFWRSGTPGDPGTSVAADADVPNPALLALDGQGNLYIGEGGLHACDIDKVILSTGVISNYLGDGTCGSTRAGLDQANHIAPFIQFQANRMAGGPQEDLYYTESAPVNNLYHGAIWDWTGAGLNLVAGNFATEGTPPNPNPQGILYDPGAITLDPSGNIYFYDYPGIVTKIDAVTHAWTQVAGNGTSGNSGDGGPATQAAIASFTTSSPPIDSMDGFPPSTSDVTLATDGSFLFIANSHYGTIRQVDLSSGVITTIAGVSHDGIPAGSTATSSLSGAASSAIFYSINDLTLDSLGNLYFYEADTNRVIGFNRGNVNPRPVITNLNPNQGAIGNLVTVTGTGFGAAQGSSSVTFNGVAATPASWSNTQINVPVPSGTTTGPVIVTVNSLSTNPGFPFTVLMQPEIYNVSPTEGTPGTTVVINGRNFGPAQGASTVNIAFPGGNKILMGSLTWSDTQIGFTVPPATGVPEIESVLLSVTNAAGSTSYGPFTYIPGPEISSITPDPGAVGARVTIYGSGFGATAGGNLVQFGSMQVTPVSWSPDSIQIDIPPGANTGMITVTSSGVQSDGFLYLVSASCSSIPSQ